MKTVVDRLNVFMAEKGLNANMVTVQAKLSNGLLGKAKKAKGGLQTDSIEKILYAFPDLNPNWLLTGRGQMLINATDPVKPSVQKDELRTLVYTVDNAGRENILLVPVRAQAGYLKGSQQQEYVEKLPSFWLPGLKNGTFRAFEVAGYSMLVDNGVGFSPGDVVIGQYLENIHDVRDGRVYVIVNTAQETDDIVLKRCLNRLEKDGVIWCKSDNRDYPMFPLRLEQIKEVWEFKRKITAQSPDPAGIYDRLNDLEARVASIEVGAPKVIKIKSE
jgi:phage repressor protein C with HTH and peptisase S24 domain